MTMNVRPSKYIIADREVRRMNAYNQGRMAYLCGRTESDNPYYPSGRVFAARDWHRGWVAERGDCAEVKQEMAVQL